MIPNESPGGEPRLTFEPMDPGPLADGDLRLELAEFGPHPIHHAPAYFFHMVAEEDRRNAGTINLRLGWDDNLTLYAGHIGYGVDEAYRGRRFAARSVRLLIPLARQHGMTELWITCNPENTASCRSCEIAGAEFVETVAVPESSVYFKRGIREKCRYRLPLQS